MTDELYLSRILGVTQGVLEALVAQEDRQDLVYHSLGPQAPQVGLEGQAPTLLWVPETCWEDVTNFVFYHKTTPLCFHGTHHKSWFPWDTWLSWQPCLSLVSLLPFISLVTFCPLRLHGGKDTHKTWFSSHTNPAS